MEWQPGPRGAGGASPDRDPGMPSGATSVRDPRLPEFASDGGQDALVPSGRLALVADEVSGPERHCPGATDDELVGLLRAWAAVESWAAGAKLGVIAELIRRDGAATPGSRRADLPDQWSASLRHELAAALACSVQSAEITAWLAWEQQARLPGIGALLNGGTLTLSKARAVTETFKYLTDADAARAEALVLDELAGKTYTQVLRLAEHRRPVLLAAGLLRLVAVGGPVDGSVASSPRLHRDHRHDRKLRYEAAPPIAVRGLPAPP